MPADALDKMLALNLRSGYRLLRNVVPTLLAQRRGAIVNIAAVAAVQHVASAAEYVASKAAAVAMVDSAAANLKGTGVRANSVLPSIINTASNRAAMPDADHATWPTPEDIARVILFLCSDDARLVNGAAIAV
jgi:NAD(P)-dependent dehydrogenase (short-subunit alcohol dehydrogenase family)